MDIAALKQELGKAQKLPIRERLKAFRAIEYKVEMAFKNTEHPTIADLDVYIDILRILFKSPCPTFSLNKNLSKIIAKRLSLLGCETPKILLKKSSSMPVDGGSIAVGDLAYAVDIDQLIADTKSTEENPIKFHLYTLDLINKGHMYIFGTGGDGYHNFQLRIIEAPEPVLNAKEYKLVMDSSPLVVLDFPSGKLAIHDSFIYKNFPCPLQVDIVPGRYKCQVHQFLLPNKANREEDDFSFYIVLCKTDAPIANDQKDIVGFG